MSTGTLPAAPAAIRVHKRTGVSTNFEQQKIRQAVMLCLVNGCRRENNAATNALADRVVTRVQHILHRERTSDVTVEHIQDLVEAALVLEGEREAAIQYLRYREEHRKIREAAMAVIDKATMEHLITDNQRFSTPLAAFQHYDKYARFNETTRRRETFPEAVTRVMSFLRSHLNKHGMDVFTEEQWAELHDAVESEDVSPAMRVMQMAGPALDRCNSGAFNCSYVAFDCIEAFAEALYLSMQGCGVGFSVENQYVGQLPLVRKRSIRVLDPDIAAQNDIDLYNSELTWDEESKSFDIHDTTEAWCDSLKLLLFSLYKGFDVRYRYHLLRPAGAPLKTKPGTASGPQPLIDLHRFIRKVFDARQGSRLRDIDAHDIGCFIGQVGQLGGVRRAAMISLSDLQSDEMRKAKFGAYWDDKGKKHRSMANNSAVYDEQPGYEVFMQEWTSLAISKSGERGIFNRGSLHKQIPTRRNANHNFGVNPCGEVILRSCGFCNLSIAVARVGDSAETLRRKVRLATILGTIQSTLTDYSYIRPAWRHNAEDERLLGVDILGAMDCPILRDPQTRDTLLAELRQIVIDTNKQFAAAMGINQAAASTVIKPGGNSSVRYNTGQTMSGWLSEFNIRNVEVAKRNAMFQFLCDEGVPWETSYRDPDTAVFSFPYPAPANGFIVSDLVIDANDNVIAVKPRRTAIDQLNDWLAFKRHWTEHNPSVSIYVADDEWLAVGDWVQKHWNEIGGLAFFPLDCGVYTQAPIQPVTRKQFDDFVTKFPSRIAWERLPAYDGGTDQTNVRAELACAGGACTI